MCASPLASASGDIWADRVVFGHVDGTAVYEPGLGIPMTFGPFNPSNPLWQDPEACLGSPNTIDYDDLSGFGPVPGGFAGGPMRRISLVWPAWQWGSTQPHDLGERPGWLDGRRQNGVGVTLTSQVVLEFDDPVENNANDDGAFHWGVDLIVHGNAAFAANATISASSNMNQVLLTGGIFSEPVEVAVAQSVAGPWYIANVMADALFPTQPWAWDSGEASWSGLQQDWRKPVDPGLSIGDFSGLSAADGIDLYAGSAGGTPVDLDRLTDNMGEPASLPWIRFVRFRDPAGHGGEICGVADVPENSAVGCTAADIADPFGVLDLSDISEFVTAFTTNDSGADLAAPFGVLDLGDISAFLVSFNEGCL